MNLTQFIKSQEASLFREAFSTFLNNNQHLIISKGETKKHTQNYSELSDYAQIGTAFDYLLRFRLSFTKLMLIDLKETIAFTAFDFLIKKHNKTLMPLIKEIAVLFEQFDKFQKGIVNKYIHKQKMTKEELNTLIKFTLYFAKLDRIYREKVEITNSYLKFETAHYMGDMYALWCNTDISLFTPNEFMELNPIIGEFSVKYPNSGYILKSDGDLIVDNRMIDIKTTNKVDYTHFIQVFCYTVMYNVKFGGKLDTIELYFSRYNRLFSIYLDSNNKEINQLISLFVQVSQK